MAAGIPMGIKSRVNEQVAVADDVEIMKCLWNNNSTCTLFSYLPDKILEEQKLSTLP